MSDYRDMNTLRTNRPASLIAALVLALLALLLVPTVASASPTPPVACGSDAECAALNPGLNSYGVSGTWKATAVSYAPLGATDVNPYDNPVVIVATDDAATTEGVAALIDAGYHGVAGDKIDALYVPANTVIDVPGGTWTVTVDGLARCVDWFTAEHECNGTEYLR